MACIQPGKGGPKTHLFGTGKFDGESRIPADFSPVFFIFVRIPNRKRVSCICWKQFSRATLRKKRMINRTNPKTLNLKKSELARLKGGKTGLRPGNLEKLAMTTFAKGKECRNAASPTQHDPDQCQKCPCGRYHCSH